MRLKSVFVTALLLISMPLFAGDEVKLQEQPEVADAIRVFDQWVEQHIAHRNVPGLSIAVVYDQEIVWAEGLRLQRPRDEDPRDPLDRLSDRFDHQALHLDRDPAAAGPGQAPTRRSGVALPPLVQCSQPLPGCP